MSRFECGYSNFTTSTAAKTAAKLIGAAAKSWEIYESGMYGSGLAAPADIQHQCIMAFSTNGGAGSGGTSPTPEPIIQNETVSALTTTVTYTSEPTTYTTNQFALFSFNQRGGMRWAVPIGMGFQANGASTQLSMGQLVKSSAAGAIDGVLQWAE
jgi:hypothetical protein